MKKIKKHPGKAEVKNKKEIDISKPRIPKPEKEVKGPGPDEAAVKKATEDYRQMLKGSRDPESQEIKFLYRFRVSKKYWDEVLAPLPGSELKVFLRHRIHADWRTGEALLGDRYIAKKEGMDKETVNKARQRLVKKGYLVKTRKATRCFFYKILKI